MSWAAHDLEPYAIQKHLGLKVAFVPLLIGSYAPDLFTKWFVYGVTVFGISLKADDPTQFHRGWPGFGFTHSLLFGMLIGLVLWRLINPIWGVSFMIGQWAHAITDVGDTVGSMLFFPWIQNIHIGAWAYAGHTGRFTDAAAYFSGLGSMWDLVFVVYGLVNWRLLTRAYFTETIVQADGFWGKARRVVPETGLLTLYRVAFFYGTCRWIAWTLWAHGINDYPYDLTWGGPHWVDAQHPDW
jgi:hypothetical protein